VNNDTMTPWSVLDDELIADFTPDELRAVVGMIELSTALGLLAHHARLLGLRAWAVTR
jgi:hypothetical protein